MLSIKITSSKDGNFLREITVSGKITIGRDASCDISLPDPEKHISRIHAIIEKQDVCFFLTVISKANPIIVNGTPFHTGKIVELKEGDRITLRSYVLDVTETSQSASSIQTDPWLNISSNFIDSTPRDPFGLNDLVVKPVTKPEISPDPFGFPTPNKQDAFNGSFAPPPGQAQDLQSILGDRLLDPMAALDSQRSSGYSGIKGSSRVPTVSHTSLEDLLSPSSLNQSNISSKANLSASPFVDFGGHQSAGTPSLQHVHDVNLPYAPPPISGADWPKSAPYKATEEQVERQQIDDPFADSLKTYIRKIPATPSQIPPVVPSQPLSPSTPNPREKRSHKDRRSNAVNQQTNQNNRQKQVNLAVDAFRRGAGLDNQSLSLENAVVFMESAGNIVRVSIEGIVALLASRSMLKGELGAENRTMVATYDNNPLKFMPDASDALQFLLDKKIINSSAYLPPDQAISGACEDLIFHELGTAAGTRAAIEVSIRRFAPRLIEAQLDKAGNKVMLNRKAKLWDMYVDNYNKIEASMADDIGRLYEQDFRLAYDDQIRKLKKK